MYIVKIVHSYIDIYTYFQFILRAINRENSQELLTSISNLFFKNYKSIGSFLVAKYSIFSKNLLMNDLAVGHIEKISI